MAQDSLPSILVLTPMKNTAPFIDSYFRNLLDLDYPHDLISVGILESDSSDGTGQLLQDKAAELGHRFRRLQLFKRDYGFSIPPSLPRWTPGLQYPRRVILAKSRNYLLSRALDDEDWVLWLDADVIQYPADVLQKLLSYGRSIIQPHCVKTPGGPTFDLNAWSQKGTVHIEDFRGMPSPQPIDAVGGTMLLIKADLHREGLIFPPFPFGGPHPAIRDVNGFLPFGKTGELETEGLGIMALAMGHQAWAAHDIEIIHAPS